MKEIVIGIDPDIYGSGVAQLNTATRSVKLYNMDFNTICAYLRRIKEDYGSMAQIHIEDSSNTTRNWHLSTRYGSTARASRMGYDVGRNHQLCFDIYDYACSLGLDISRQMPFKKCWKGKDGKITHEEICSFMSITDRTTNQEKRDAALIAWLCAGLPITIPPRKGR